MKIGLGLFTFLSVLFTLIYVDRNQAPPFKQEIVEMIVYQSKTCGCCKKWVNHLAESGLMVKSVFLDDVSGIKSKLQVPKNLSSCHTASINGYVVEGHVPSQAIFQMLRDKPKIRGISVPGMPIGSPGMEGNFVESYDVISFKKDGAQAVFLEF